MPFSVKIFCVVSACWIAVTMDSGNVFGQTPMKFRVATFNCSLNRTEAGALQRDLNAEGNDQAIKIASILQTVRPDLLLLNEFDYDAEQAALQAFLKNYLAVGQNGLVPLDYPYHYSQEVNTGVDSGLDLNNDGKLHTPDDALGFGQHPGQYGMVVLSRFPIEAQKIRTFQEFRWSSMPDALWPIKPDIQEPFYSDELKKIFRLSSKSHWDVPIQVGGSEVHFLVCHPTPPVFDGSEDRNGTRNHDEIRFWADYVSNADYFVDDQKARGGLPTNSLFVIAGDMNADPSDGDNRDQAIRQLLDCPTVQDPLPKSEGGVQASQVSKGKNEGHKGDPALDTGDFGDRTVGNLRTDYVLPSRQFQIVGSGVFWPKNEEPEGRWLDASDHRLVWVDLNLPKAK